MAMWWPLIQVWLYINVLASCVLEAIIDNFSHWDNTKSDPVPYKVLVYLHLTYASLSSVNIDQWYTTGSLLWITIPHRFWIFPLEGHRWWPCSTAGSSEWLSIPTGVLIVELTNSSYAYSKVTFRFHLIARDVKNSHSITAGGFELFMNK